MTHSNSITGEPKQKYMAIAQETNYYVAEAWAIDDDHARAIFDSMNHDDFSRRSGEWRVIEIENMDDFREDTRASA